MDRPPMEEMEDRWEERKKDRKRGEQYLYGGIEGCLNLIFWIIVIICIVMVIYTW